MSDLLQVRDLSVRFATPGGHIDAVKHVSFRLRQASTVALVGESGSGKSAVSQAILRILPRNGLIATGQILFDDPRTPDGPVDLAQLPADGPQMRSVRGGRISIVFQEPMSSLSPLHTVGDQVGEALSLHREATGAQVTELTLEMLRLVGFPDPILDEPTTALDVTIQAQILKLVVELQHELNMAVLLITHDLGVVANIAKEIVVMYHGEVMESGTLEDIFRRAAHPYLQALLRAVPRFDMAPGERLVPLREIPTGDAPYLMADRPARPDPTKSDKAPGETAVPLLECIDLKKSFGLRRAGIFGSAAAGRVVAVDGVSLTIARGECLGLVGESGCGKTTLSKMLLRAVEPDSGQVLFNDSGTVSDVLALQGDALKQFRRKVQFIFQDPFGSLNPRMTVADIIEEPLVIHSVGDGNSRREIVAELANLVGLDVRHLRRYPHSFSGGQRQRIGIARALALRPDLVICDEPVSALDVSIQAQVLNLLIDLKEKLGLTYLFISHNLAVVDYIADRVAVMCAGRIVEIAGRGVLFRDPVHPYTQALLAAVPAPDLAHPLDLHRLMEDKASEPTAWPEPFRRGAAEPLRFFEVGPGHFVEATEMPAMARGDVSMAAAT